MKIQRMRQRLKEMENNRSRNNEENYKKTEDLTLKNKIIKELEKGE